MSAQLRSFVCKAAICALLIAATTTAKAQIGVTKSQADWIVVGIAASGAVIGIAVFYAFHHGHSLTGCAVSGFGGLQLQNRGDGQTYDLVGAVAEIKPGNRVRVSGKKTKKSGGAAQQFVVERLSNDYGACKAEAAMR